VLTASSVRALSTPPRSSDTNTGYGDSFTFHKSALVQGFVSAKAGHHRKRVSLTPRANVQRNRRSCSSFASSPNSARFSPDGVGRSPNSQPGNSTHCSSRCGLLPTCDPRRANVQGSRLFFGRRRTKPGIYQSLTIPVTHGGLTPAAPAHVRVYIADGAICSEHPLYTQERSA
jgi:hypothetical protein